MTVPFKIGTVPQDQVAQVNANRMELLYEIYKNSPLIQGVKRDGFGNFDFEGKDILGVPALPQSIDEIASVTFLNNTSLLAGLALGMYLSQKSAKVVAHAATTEADGNIPLLGSFPLVIDGVVMTTPTFCPAFQLDFSFDLQGLEAFSTPGVPVFYNSVLLKNQTNSAENGLYMVLDAGSNNYVMVRGPWVALSYQTHLGIFVAVQAGVVNAKTRWSVSTSLWSNPLAATNLQWQKMPEKVALATSASNTVGDLKNDINNLLDQIKAAGIIQ